MRSPYLTEFKHQAYADFLSLNIDWVESDRSPGLLVPSLKRMVEDPNKPKELARFVTLYVEDSKMRANRYTGTTHFANAVADELNAVIRGRSRGGCLPPWRVGATVIDDITTNGVLLMARIQSFEDPSHRVSNVLSLLYRKSDISGMLRARGIAHHQLLTLGQLYNYCRDTDRLKAKTT